MSKLEITLSVILLISTCINIGLFAYARAAITRLLNVADELWDLQLMVDSFAKHLQSVYELETFYGDETLNGLLNHAASLNEQIGTFEHIYTLMEEEIEETEDEYDTDPGTAEEEAS
jgi:hypothetical protein